MKLSRLSLLALIGLVTTSAAVAETKISAAGLTIKISPENGRYAISVTGTGGKKIQSSSAFALSNPPRLVVDLPNFHSKGSVTKNVMIDGISSVRIGSHPDKTRVVFDLTGGVEVAPGKLTTTSSAHSVVLSVNAPTVVAKGGNKREIQATIRKNTRVAKADTSKREVALQRKVLRTGSESKTSELPSTDLNTALSLQIPSEVSDELPAVTDKTVALSSPTPGFGEAPNSPSTENEITSSTNESSNDVIADGGSSVRQQIEIASNVSSQTASDQTLPKTGEEMEEVAALSHLGVATSAVENEPLSGALLSSVAAGEQDALQTEATSTEVPDIAMADPSTPSDSEESVASTSSEPIVGRAMVDSQQATPPPVIDGTSSVKGIYFRPIDQSGEPALLIETVGLQNYWFSRKDKKLFEITLENAQLSGDFLKLAQFPPNKFDGFEAVSAEQRGKDSVVKVFVGDEYRISPFRKEGQLWVRLMK